MNKNTDWKKINEQVKWQDMTVGASIFEGGTSQAFETGEWRVNTPVFEAEKCKQCLLCIPVCPDSSIPMEGEERLDFDFSHCKGCGICAKVCPFDAITMKEGAKP